MQLISCHNGRLLSSAFAEQNIPRPKVFTTGLSALDQLLPNGGLVGGAIHEILSEKQHGTPRLFALLLARSATPGLNQAKTRSAIIWCDPHRELYPPAVAALGVPLNHLHLLRPRSPADQIWAVAECLRCKGVSATIAQIERMSRIEARRLQLAAEAGGGVGILLRRLDRNAAIYAAATRWLVSPARGDRAVQRWKIQLLHGHGGCVGQTIILEHHRETSTIQAVEKDLLREAAELADRQIAARSRASA